jgi:hypothetical protein
MTPEQMAALKSLLDSQGQGHPDAGQDYDQICEVVENKLAPVFQIIGEELKSLRDENNELKDTLYKLIGGFHDSIGQYKRGSLQSSLTEKYGGDLDALKPIYSDFAGRDITEDLLDALMEQEGDPHELAGSFIEAAKGKYGKYMPKPEVSVEIESKPIEESVGNAPEEKAEVEESTDPVEIMKQKVLALRKGRKTA